MRVPTLPSIASSVPGLRCWPWALVALLLVAMAPLAEAGTGDVDPSYGVNGRFEARRHGEYFVFPPLADGRLLYPANGGYRRTDADGRPDASFGKDGVQPWPQGYFTLGSGSWARARDGKLLVALNRQGPNGSEHALMRLGFDGEPDPAFGANGFATVDVPPNGSQSQTALAVQPDGKLLLLLARHDPRDWYFLDALQLVRLLPDGRPDTTFGTGGTVPVPTNRIDALDGVSLGLLTDGHVVVSSDPVTYLTEFGVPTSSLPAGSRARIAALLPDGGAIAWTATDAGDRLSKIRADGTVDGTFGPSGDGTVALPPESDGSGYLFRVNVSSDGQYLYLSWGNSPGGGWWVTRLFVNGPKAGKVDHSFGEQGTENLRSYIANGYVHGSSDGSAIVTTADYAFRLLGHVDPSPGFVGRAAAGPWSWPESGGVAELRLFRAAGSNGPVSVRYATLAGSGPGQSATPGEDFDPVSGTLDWSDGDDGDKVIRIPLRQDKAVEGTEQIYVVLEVLTPGTWIADSLVPVAIDDSREPPSPTTRDPVKGGSSSGGGGAFGWSGLLLMLMGVLGRRFLRHRPALRVAVSLPAPVLLLLSGLAQAQLAPGDVDPTFAYARPAVEPPDSTNAVPLPNGYLVIRSRMGVATAGDSTLSVTLIDLDGRIIDYGFGTDGTYTNTLPGRVDLALATSRQANGAVLLGGYKLKDGSTTDSMAAVARVDGTGRLDPAFGEAGVATIDAPGERDRIAAVAVLPDGRIAALVWSMYPNPYDCATDLVRLYYLQPDGTDARAGVTAIRDSYAATSCRTSATLHVDPDGTVLIGTELGVLYGDGYSAGDSLLPSNWRYGPFAKDAQLGLVGTTIGGQGVDVFLGQRPSSSDNHDGLVEAAGYGAPATWSKLVVDAARQAVYVAFATDDGQVGVARFKADGSLDTGWGRGDGVVAIIGSAWPAASFVTQGLATEARLLHVDADGRLVVVTADGAMQRLVGGNAPSPGAFVLMGPLASVTEGSVSVPFTVRRVGGSAGAASVTVTAIACDNSPGQECPYLAAAQPEEDFRVASQRLDWADGDATDRTVSVQLVDDNLAESEEVFLVEISEVTEGFGVLTRSVPVVIISDEKPDPGPTPGGSGHAGGGGSGRTGLIVLLLLAAVALRRHWVATGCRDVVSARNGV